MISFRRIHGYSISSILLTASLILSFLPLHAQRTVSITIDDVPNTRMYQDDNFHSPLLDSLDAMHIPITIFINEGALDRTNARARNREVLRNWMARDYITPGNHTLHHARYSAVGIDSFKVEIDSGELLTRMLAHQYHKSLDYFRFPYNDLGKDSVEHHAIAAYLHARKYVLTPFTVESSDYMYNYIYADLLRTGNGSEAARIGEEYIGYTLRLFQYIDSLSMAIYGRQIHQIYLCHDNPLNRDYLNRLIRTLSDKGYTCISLAEALTDPVYSQPSLYYKKWGISWLYRWITGSDERRRCMQAEPPMKEINDRYDAMMKKQEK
ncbi:MAG: polysaccharide deacetylase family protein [Candidatus Kapaibacterium sp.]